MAFPTGWNYRRSIAIDSGQKSGSPSGIVLTITHDSGIADADGPLDADGSAPSQNGGGDIRVSSDAAGTTQIPVDVVSWVTDNDHASATCEIKVNFDDLSSDTLYLWWGTAGTESQPAVTDTYGRNAVYSSGSHAAYYTMDENPSGGAPQITDRTGNGNNLTSAGSMTAGDLVIGKFGSALDFEGTDDRVEVDSGVVTAAPLTLSAWFYSHSATATQTIVGLADKDATEHLFRLNAAGGTGGDPVTAELWDDVVFDASAATSTGYSVNTWHRATAIFISSTSRKARIDGGSSGTSSVSVSPAGIDRLSLGRIGDATPALYFNGLIDNVAVYSRAISDDDDTTLYNCESDNATFWSVGSVQSVGGGSGGYQYNSFLHSLIGAC